MIQILTIWFLRESDQANSIKPTMQTTYPQQGGWKIASPLLGGVFHPPAGTKKTSRRVENGRTENKT